MKINTDWQTELCKNEREIFYILFCIFIMLSASVIFHRLIKFKHYHIVIEIAAETFSRTDNNSDLNCVRIMPVDHFVRILQDFARIVYSII